MKNAFMVWNDLFTAAELDAFEAHGDMDGSSAGRARGGKAHR
jgi:hypothetical protein